MDGSGPCPALLLVPLVFSLWSRCCRVVFGAMMVVEGACSAVFEVGVGVGVGGGCACGTEG